MYVCMYFFFLLRTSRQRRPDRAVYIPRHRRSLETEGSPQPSESARVNRIVKDSLLSAFCGQSRSSSNVREMDSETDVQQNMECEKTRSNTYFDNNQSNGDTEVNVCQEDPKETISSIVPEEPTMEASNEIAIEQLFTLNEDVPNDSNSAPAFEDKCEITDTEFQAETLEEQEISSNSSEIKNNLDLVETCIYSEINVNEEIDRSDKYKDDIIMINSDANNKKHAEISNKDEITNQKNVQMMRRNMVSNVLIISDTVQKEPEPVKEVIPVPLTSPEKKVKKVIRQKSKPAPPPSPPVKKMNRDECDWDSLFDDNGDCLDPTLIEEASIHKVILSFINIKE